MIKDCILAIHLTHQKWGHQTKYRGTMWHSNRFFIIIGLIGLGLFLADNCCAAADAHDAAIGNASEQMDKAKSLVTVILSIASIICLGSIAWITLVNRDARIISIGIVSLAVAVICSVILSTM